MTTVLGSRLVAYLTVWDTSHGHTVRSNQFVTDHLQQSHGKRTHYHSVSDEPTQHITQSFKVVSWAIKLSSKQCSLGLPVPAVPEQSAGGK